MTTEIHIHGPVTFITAKETPAKVPSAPPRPVPKPPTDNGGRPISRGTDLPGTSAAKCDSGPKTRWRVWSEERPKEGEHILVRFEFWGISRSHIAYLDGETLMNDSCRSLFAGSLEDPSETIYRIQMPADIRWIPLAELLKGVE